MHFLSGAAEVTAVIGMAIFNFSSNNINLFPIQFSRSIKIELNRKIFWRMKIGEKESNLFCKKENLKRPSLEPL